MTTPPDEQRTGDDEVEIRRTLVVGICRNKGEPFYWDADRIGEPCPDVDCSRNAFCDGDAMQHDYYVLAESHTCHYEEAEDDE